MKIQDEYRVANPFEFLRNSSFTINSYRILPELTIYGQYWHSMVATIEYQFWQDPIRIRQHVTNYAKLDC